MIRRRDIGSYMHRWIAALPCGFMVRVHHIREPDADAELHDHPFWFVSLVLRGWYVEERAEDDGRFAHDLGEDDARGPGGPRVYTTRRAGSLTYRSANCAHRIASVSRGGVWTLVVGRRAHPTWGFWTADGWVGWREFVTRKPGVIVNHEAQP